MKVHRRFSKETVQSLTERFLDGEHLTIREIVTEYLGEPGTTLQQKLFYQTARQWIHTAKSHMKKEGEFLCVIGEDDVYGKQFGIIRTAAHAKTAFHAYYTLTRGIVKSVVLLHKNVQHKHLLPGQIQKKPLLLPQMRGEK